LGVAVLCLYASAYAHYVYPHPDPNREVMRVQFESKSDAKEVINTITQVVQEVIEDADSHGIPVFQYEQQFDATHGSGMYRVSLANEIKAHAGAFAKGISFLEITGLDVFWHLLLPGDVNKDGVVDLVDLGLLGKAYSSHLGDPNYNWDADFNKDWKVDLTDQAIMGQHWAQTLHSCNPADCAMRPDRNWLTD